MAILEYANKNNIKILAFYIDNGYTGTNDNRPQFIQMFQDLDNKAYKNINGVIVHKLDRFSRDRLDALVYKNKLKKKGLSLLSVLERIEESPEGLILDAVITAMAEYYSKNLSREVLKGFTIKARNEEFLGGNIPFGCFINNKKIELKKEYAPIIKKIFLMAFNDFKTDYILNYIKQETQETLTQKQLKSLLKNKVYLGQYIRQLKNGVLLSSNIKERAVSLDLFNAVNEKEYNKQKRARERAVLLLSGALSCSLCLDTLKYKNTFKEKNIYNCKNNHFKINAHKLQNIFITCVTDYLQDAKIKKLFCTEYIKNKTLGDFNLLYSKLIYNFKHKQNTQDLRHFLYTILLFAKIAKIKNNNYLIFKFLNSKTKIINLDN